MVFNEIIREPSAFPLTDPNWNLFLVRIISFSSIKPRIVSRLGFNLSHYFARGAMAVCIIKEF